MRTTTIIDVGNDFNKAPAGRYLSDGPASGEAFRQKLLIPKIKEFDRVIVDFDNSAPVGSSFLSESFGRLNDIGLTKEQIKNKLEIKADKYQIIKSSIDRYIDKAFDY